MTARSNVGALGTVRALPLLLLLAASAVPSAAAQVVRGVVRDAASGEPIAGAPVRLLNDRGYERRTVTTDASGAFSFHAPASGAYWLRAEPTGFAFVESRPFVLAREDSLDVALETGRQAIAIEGVTGVSRRQNRNFAGFLDRQRFGWATRYLDPEDVSRMRGARASDFLLGLAPGVVPAAEGGILFTNRGRRCTPTVIVDGFAHNDVPIDQLVTASDVRAVELYMQPEFIPPQLSSARNGCGAVALWTHFGLGIE